MQAPLSFLSYRHPKKFKMVGRQRVESDHLDFTANYWRLLNGGLLRLCACVYSVTNCLMNIFNLPICKLRCIMSIIKTCLLCKTHEFFFTQQHRKHHQWPQSWISAMQFQSQVPLRQFLCKEASLRELTSLHSLGFAPFLCQ